jgi:LPXTG-motif cell wall-anchored protein
MNILLTILIILGILVVLVAGLFFWKRSKDISDMKKLAAAIAVACRNPNEYANCYIDKIIDKYGYLRTKAIVTGEVASAEETAFIVKSSAECNSIKCV